MFGSSLRRIFLIISICFSVANYISEEGDDCSGDCSENEEYNECGTACPLTCRNFGIEFFCVQTCVPGCFCKEGLVRNDDGWCIRPDQCLPDKCPENEEYNECGTACPLTCRNFGTEFFCVQICVKGCFCKEGLIRNDDGSCVRPDQCLPDNRCPANEEYQECGTLCPRTCANYGAMIKCVAGCKKGCFCKEGFIRNDDGKCVKPEQCVPGGCSPGKVYTTCVNPCNDCYRKGICENPGECVKGCDCPPGQYMMGYAGTCVPEEQCPITQCPDNEVYKDCGTACPLTCKNYKDTDFGCIQVCREGCFCKDGLVRNDDGICVKPEECVPAQCPDNEVYKDCGTACPLTCKNYKDTDFACIQVCREGCFCKDGLVRNDDGICVKPEECVPDQCPENEEYQSCGTACPETCKNFGIKINCLAVCVKGCFCKKGFIRNDDGICVEPSQCVPGGCPINEQYSGCVDICNDCSIEGACSFLVCNSGCDCITGYTRSAQNKICIPNGQCPENNCPVNEVYSTCVNPCNDCYTKGNCNFLVCNKGCDCRKGYYRDEKTRKCIPEAQCPPSND